MARNEETRYCPGCDNETAEWETGPEGGDVCLDCGGGLYSSYDDYRGEMVRWLGEAEDMPPGEVNDLLDQHGNPTKGQVLGIIEQQRGGWGPY